MTGRERLNQRKRWVAGGAVGGLGLLAAGAAAGHALGDLPAAAFAAPGIVALLVLATAGQRYLFRCPWCRGKLGTLLMHSGWWRMDPKVRFCPYCGADFDDAVDAAGAWDDPVE
jgi:hypothetical protein